MAGHEPQELHLGKFEASGRLQTIAVVCVFIGLITFIVGLVQNPERIWPAYLTSFFYFSCLALGGLFFAAINHVASAGWSVTVRRYSEALTAFIPFVLFGSLVLLAGLKVLYPWSRPEVVAVDPLIATKVSYLNAEFLTVRLLVFGLGMWLFKWLIVGNSLKQDVTGDEDLTRKNSPLSVVFLLFFSLSFSLFSVDLLMSLLPHWFSTIFGVYAFAGLFQSTMAALILISLWLNHRGVVKGYVTLDHVHDLAKYLKGFTVFWAYIAFSQFMLIWYTNIPEETEFYMLRVLGGWMPVSVALLMFKFVVPFIALLPRWAKRTPAHLIAVCVLILVMQYVDVFWLVYPNFNDNHLVFSFWEIGMFLGFGGIFLLCLQRFLASHSLVPVKDPRLDEALRHHVTY